MPVGIFDVITAYACSVMGPQTLNPCSM